MNQLMQNQTTEECSICCENKPRGTSQQQQMRLIGICYDCWYQHISNFVLRISYKVGDDVLSPFHDSAPIDIIKCLNSLKPEHAKEIQETLFRKYSSFTKDIQKCPAQSCDFVYVGQKCRWKVSDNIYNCPKCEMPLVTNQQFSFKSLTASLYLLLSNKCPKCSIPIQKISGCPHMTCPCGHHFCWYCYKDHPSGNGKRIYTMHNIPECSFIFLSKFFFFFISLFSILLSSNGNTTVNWITSIISSLMMLLTRAFLIDGIILIQIMFTIMMKKSRSFKFGRAAKNNRLIFGLIITNIIILGILHLIDELSLCMLILFGQICLAAFSFGIGYVIILSIQTWFQFIA